MVGINFYFNCMISIYKKAHMITVHLLSTVMAKYTCEYSNDNMFVALFKGNCESQESKKICFLFFSSVIFLPYTLYRVLWNRNLDKTFSDYQEYFNLAVDQEEEIHYLEEELERTKRQINVSWMSSRD